jgi:hypothetical protein
MIQMMRIGYNQVETLRLQNKLKRNNPTVNHKRATHNYTQHEVRKGSNDAFMGGSWEWVRWMDG